MDSFYIYQMVVTYGTKLLVAILVLLIGLKVIKLISKGLSKRFEKAELDPSLRPFLVSLVKITLQVLLIVSVISMLGIAMTSFIAVFGAVAFAVGLSLQGAFPILPVVF